MNTVHPQLSIIIPAAGASERLGQPKQLVQYKGKSLIRKAIENAESLAPDEIIVVTGADADAVQAEVKKTTAKGVYNPNWRDGMGTSIAFGAKAVDDRSDGILILLCDQWQIQAEDLQLLLKAWQTDPGYIVCAVTRDRHGPPVIFPVSCLQELRGLSGDHGARSILDSAPDKIKPVTIKHAAFDLDTPFQLEELNQA